MLQPLIEYIDRNNISSEAYQNIIDLGLTKHLNINLGENIKRPMMNI